MITHAVPNREHDGRQQAGATNAIPIWEEPVRGAYPDPRLFQLSGMDQMRASMMGRWPRPPMSHLSGLVFSHIDDGEGVMEQPASPWFLSSQGVIPGGFLAVVADCALGIAIYSKLPSRTPMTTSEISINFIRPATAAGRVLRGRASALHVSNEMALAECVVEDRAGGILAHGTTRTRILDQLPYVDVDGEDAIDNLASAMDVIPVSPAPTYDTPGPIDRAVVGEALPREIWDRASGREILERQIHGELPMPPIHHLTGMRPTSVGDGEATFALPCTAWLTSGLGTVLGGFSATLAYSALASAIQTTTEPGTAHIPVDLKINFLRPLYPDPNGRDMVATGQVVHRGHTLCVADSEVRSPDGKLIAVARGTSMLLPGQPAWAAA